MADYSRTVEPRYNDLDGMNHVNHAVFVTYMETARNEFFEEVLGMDFDTPDVVVASLQIDYRGPIDWTDTVTVDVDLGDVRDRSFNLTYELTADSQPVATAETTQVTVDPETGESRAIPDAYRSVFESLR